MFYISAHFAYTAQYVIQC